MKIGMQDTLDEYVVMPNPIPGIIVLTESVGAIHESPLPKTKQQRRKKKLSKIIGRFKMNAAKEINIIKHTSRKSVWQRNNLCGCFHNDILPFVLMIR
jgi:hypothetical protein